MQNGNGIAKIMNLAGKQTFCRKWESSTWRHLTNYTLNKIGEEEKASYTTVSGICYSETVKYHSSISKMFIGLL